MISVEKTLGIKEAANDVTILRLQEVIVLSKEQYGWVGKAVIDSEKITFSKFGLKLGIARHSTNGFVVDENGVIKYVGFITPMVYDHQLIKNLYKLFAKKCPWGN